MSHRAATRKKIEEAAPHFEVSDSLRQFLPPTTEYTMGHITAWFKVESRIKGGTEEEEPPSPRRAKN